MYEIFSKDLPIDESCPLSSVYWIYHEDKHTDPRTSGYVGVSKRGTEERMKVHVRGAASGSSCRVHRAMRKYGDKIKVKTLFVADPEMCLLIEEELRPTVNMGGQIWNISAGGCSPYQVSSETCQKISAGTKGRVVSEDAKKRIAAARLGKPRSEGSRNKQSEVLLKRPWLTGRASANTRKVWLEAAEIHEVYLTHQPAGPLSLVRLLGGKYKVSSLTNMLNRFRDGWCPTSDPNWIEFKQSQQEAANAETSTQPSTAICDSI